MLKVRCFEQKYKNIEHPSMVKDLEKENRTLDEENNRILACQKKEEEERRQRLQNLAKMANVSSKYLSKFYKQIIFT